MQQNCLNNDTVNPLKNQMARLLKTFIIFVLLLAAAVQVFAIFEFVSRDSSSFWESIFIAAFGLAMSALMGLFAFGAIKTPSADLYLEAKIVMRLGFTKAKKIDPEEFDRLVRMEKSIDLEIRERTAEANADKVVTRNK